MKRIFKPRLTAPTKDNHWYGVDCVSYHSKYNMFEKHDGKFGNCTHYAIARFQELLGKICKLKEENADKFLDTAKKVGYPTGMLPKLGSIIVWKHTTKKNGHVGVVEKIYSNGDLLISMSGWKSFLFTTRRVYKSKGYVYSDYKLLGFIYPEDIDFYDFAELPTLPLRGYFYAKYNKKTDKYIVVDTGKEVIKLQKFLSWALNIDLRVKGKWDGKLGRDTRDAIIQFQKLVGIKKDGKFGKNSLSKAKKFCK